MFYYYTKVLKQLKPKMFLAENVKGLVNHNYGKTLQTMLNVFKEVGYNVQYKILNVWNYGVAEKRKRIVIIRIRNDLKVKYNYPTPYKHKLVLHDVLKDVPKDFRILKVKRKSLL